MGNWGSDFSLSLSSFGPLAQIPEEPDVMRLIIAVVAIVTIGVAIFSLTHGIGELYQFLFLLPIVMTAYFFPRYGIPMSIFMGLSLIFLNLIFEGNNFSALMLPCFIFAVLLGIGGIITMMSENISGLKKHYQDIFAISGTGIIIFNRKTSQIVEANPSFLALLGYALNKDQLPIFKDLFEKPQQYLDLIDKITSFKSVDDWKCNLVTSSNGSRQFQISARSFFDDFILCTFTDFTERKMFEDNLHQSLVEKEILLNEVHHRVKNNMQVIMSLLQLNALNAETDMERAKYAEMQGRVMTMALIHEKLYQSPVAGLIDAGDYFLDLLKNIVSASALPNIQCTVEAPGVFLDIDKAIPCGLIVNELATNSIKYAFSDIKTPEICLTLIKNGDNVCSLNYSDNGKGIPSSYDVTSSETLGLRLIHMLVRQLKGTISITSEAGSHFLIRFPLSSPNKILKVSDAAQINEQTTISHFESESSKRRENNRHIETK